MKHNKTLLVTDNPDLFERFQRLTGLLGIDAGRFSYCCTSPAMRAMMKNCRRINVKKEYHSIIRDFDLVISLHCKQIFPVELVKSVTCINVHPGFNPYNRGWYPQVFSILNKLPVGATIHEMDEWIDHGKIIDQLQVEVNAWDTSLDVYNRVLDAEWQLLEKNLPSILAGTYIATPPSLEGNYNSVDDFKALLEIDLDKTDTCSHFIDRLRALTHGNFRNAYFIDPVTRKKVFVKINLEPE